RIGFGSQQHYTTWAVTYEYAVLINLFLKELGLAGPENILLGLGEGNGMFIGMISRAAGFRGSIFTQDMSPMLLKMQREAGARKAVLGSVTEGINFETGFAAIEHAHELFDAIPCRLFVLVQDKDGRLFIRAEWFVDERGEPVMEPVSAKDDFMLTYEDYLNCQVPELSVDFPLNVAVADYRILLQEMHRVLSSEGIAILVDYGYSGVLQYLASGEKAYKVMPYSIMHSQQSDWQDVLKYPGTVDLTYMVDFGFVRHLAERSGLSVESFETLPHFAKEILQRNGYLLEDGSVPVAYRDITASEEYPFKVMVLANQKGRLEEKGKPLSQVVRFIEDMPRFLQALEEVYGWEGIDCSYGVAVFSLLLHDKFKELGYEVPISSEGPYRIQFINIEVSSYSAAIWPHYALVVYWAGNPVLYIDPTFSRFFGTGKRSYEILVAPIQSVEKQELQRVFDERGIEATIYQVNIGQAWQPAGFNTVQMQELVSRDLKMSQVLGIMKFGK
ncbi:MAG: hypothetical protein FJZ08_01235, partial [Candidatus Omnitrophica bacterium]|nr:hypothetical protein [Candidatus Omnitrophota bacterium]